MPLRLSPNQLDRASCKRRRGALSLLEEFCWWQLGLAAEQILPTFSLDWQPCYARPNPTPASPVGLDTLRSQPDLALRGSKKPTEEFGLSAIRDCTHVMGTCRSKASLHVKSAGIGKFAGCDWLVDESWAQLHGHLSLAHHRCVHMHTRMSVYIDLPT